MWLRLVAGDGFIEVENRGHGERQGGKFGRRQGFFSSLFAVGEKFLGVRGVGGEAREVFVAEGDPTLEFLVLRISAGGEAETTAEALMELFLPGAVDVGEEALGELARDLEAGLVLHQHKRLEGGK